MHRLCGIIITITLTNTAITSHSYHFCFVVRMLKIYHLSKFQANNNTVLLTIVTMLSFRSSELIHLITESLYPFEGLL